MSSFLIKTNKVSVPVLRPPIPYTPILKLAKRQRKRSKKWMGESCDIMEMFVLRLQSEYFLASLLYNEDLTTVDRRRIQGSVREYGSRSFSDFVT